MLKKIIFTIIALLATVGISKASLWEYFNGNLPSVQDRSNLAKSCDLNDYTGTYDQNVALENCLRENVNLGSSGGLPVSDYETTLTQPLTSTASTIYVASVKTKDNHTLTTADIAPAAYLVLEPDSSTKKEIIKCTGISGSTWTGCIRGLAFYGTNETSVADNRKSHSAGIKVSLSNVHFYYVSPSISNTWTALQIFATSTDDDSYIQVGTSTPVFFKEINGVAYYCNNGLSCAAIGGGANTYNFERPLITSGSNVKFASSTYDFLLRDNLFALATSTISNGTASGKALDDLFNARWTATTTKETLYIRGEAQTASTTLSGNTLLTGNTTITGNVTTTKNIDVGGMCFLGADCHTYGFQQAQQKLDSVNCDPEGLPSVYYNCFRTFNLGWKPDWLKLGMKADCTGDSVIDISGELTYLSSTSTPRGFTMIAGAIPNTDATSINCSWTNSSVSSTVEFTDTGFIIKFGAKNGESYEGNIIWNGSWVAQKY